MRRKIWIRSGFPYGHTDTRASGLVLERDPHHRADRRRSINIIYCRPGTKYLERLLDNYVQWCMRRVNGLVPTTYGGLIGRGNGKGGHTWRRQWTLEIDQLQSAIEEMLA